MDRGAHGHTAAGRRRAAAFCHAFKPRCLYKTRFSFDNKRSMQQSSAATVNPHLAMNATRDDLWFMVNSFDPRGPPDSHRTTGACTSVASVWLHSPSAVASERAGRALTRDHPPPPPPAAPPSEARRLVRLQPPSEQRVGRVRVGRCRLRRRHPPLACTPCRCPASAGTKTNASSRAWCSLRRCR
jgi:hypothetical protein